MPFLFNSGLSALVMMVDILTSDFSDFISEARLIIFLAISSDGVLEGYSGGGYSATGIAICVLLARART